MIQNRYRIRRARLESVLFRARLGGQESRIKPQFDHGRLEACRRKPCHCKKNMLFFLASEAAGDGPINRRKGSSQDSLQRRGLGIFCPGFRRYGEPPYYRLCASPVGA